MLTEQARKGSRRPARHAAHTTAQPARRVLITLEAEGGGDAGGERAEHHRQHPGPRLLHKCALRSFQGPSSPQSLTNVY